MKTAPIQAPLHRRLKSKAARVPMPLQDFIDLVLRIGLRQIPNNPTLETLEDLSNETKKQS